MDMDMPNTPSAVLGDLYRMLSTSLPGPVLPSVVAAFGERWGLRPPRDANEWRIAACAGVSDPAVPHAMAALAVGLAAGASARPEDVRVVAEAAARNVSAPPACVRAAEASIRALQTAAEAVSSSGILPVGSPPPDTPECVVCFGCLDAWVRAWSCRQCASAACYACVVGLASVSFPSPPTCPVCRIAFGSSAA